MAVGAHRENLYAHGLELIVFALKVLQFSGADKGEVGRIEEKQCPLAFDVLVADGFEIAVLESLNGELGCVLIDDRFHNLLFFINFVLCCCEEDLCCL